MVEDIRTIKSSNKLNKEERRKIKTTELQVKIVKMQKILKNLISSIMYKMFKVAAEKFVKNCVHTIKVKKMTINQCYG